MKETMKMTLRTSALILAVAASANTVSGQSFQDEGREISVEEAARLEEVARRRIIQAQARPVNRIDLVDQGIAEGIQAVDRILNRAVATRQQTTDLPTRE